MPDRLPSLIVLVGFWIVPAAAGWVAAGAVMRDRAHTRRPQALLAASVVVYAALWFAYNVGRMPPYVPGATMDPTYASPEAVRWLALFTTTLILPGSALAAALAYWRRLRTMTLSH